MGTARLLQRAIGAAFVIGGTGCFDPQPEIGIACGGDPPTACPGGQVCLSGICKLPSPDDAGEDLPDAPPDACTSCTTDDMDGDNVLDSVDNCVNKANADQDNEDGDATGDACDKCPAFADTGSDIDGDGVGDLCDPNPAVAGERIVAFVGFQHGLPTGWTVAGNGTVVASGGTAQLTAPSNEAAMLLLPEPTAATVTISADATFDAFAGGGALAGLGITARHNTGSDSGIACQLVGGNTVEKLRLFDANAIINIDEVDHPAAIGTRTVLVMKRTGTAYRCSATAPLATTTGTANFAPMTPHVGLRVRSGAGKYRWVMIVTTP